MNKLIFFAIAVSGILSMISASAKAQSADLPERVTFPSADAHTILVGYLYRPLIPAAQAPAIVMMHGRSGAYSSKANGIYDGSTLSKRHKAWGGLLAQQGYYALMADSFGPRGYPGGFARYSYNDRPEELNEVTVRPLDAYGAAAYLRTLPGVAGDRLGLLGWSNGGSATLAAMSPDAPGLIAPVPNAGFRAAVAFYPACGLKDKFKDKAYRPYAPLRVFHGQADEETSASRCAGLVEQSKAEGGDIEIALYPGATHDFDDPGEKRQSVEANAEAAEQATAEALRFFGKHLK
jgi:carboxymethylenebutenolidase